MILEHVAGILHPSGGRKHCSKWMLLLLCVWTFKWDDVSTLYSHLVSITLKWPLKLLWASVLATLLLTFVPFCSKLTGYCKFKVYVISRSLISEHLFPLSNLEFNLEPSPKNKNKKKQGHPSLNKSWLDFWNYRQKTTCGAICHSCLSLAAVPWKPSHLAWQRLAHLQLPLSALSPLPRHQP